MIPFRNFPNHWQKIPVNISAVQTHYTSCSDGLTCGILPDPLRVGSSRLIVPCSAVSDCQSHSHFPRDLPPHLLMLSARCRTWSDYSYFCGIICPSAMMFRADERGSRSHFRKEGPDSFLLSGITGTGPPYPEDCIVIPRWLRSRIINFRTAGTDNFGTQETQQNHNRKCYKEIFFEIHCFTPKTGESDGIIPDRVHTAELNTHFTSAHL